MALGQQVEEPLRPTEPATRQFETFQDVLAARGVDASQLSHMFDDRPYSMDEQETLERTLAALVNLPRTLFASYAHAQEDLHNCMVAPEEHRGDLIELSGIVTSARAIAVAPELRERLGYSVIFRCTVNVTVDGATYPCDVFSPIAPLAWLPAKEEGAQNAQPPRLGDEVKFFGVFLKRSRSPGTDQEPAHAVLATRRFAWYPENQLGQARFDAASLEEIVPDGALAAADAPAFHGLLQAMQSLDQSELSTAAQQTLRDRGIKGTNLRQTSRNLMVQFMADPKAWRGEVVSLQGIARRALKVHVDNEDRRAEFGVNEYYEVEVFIDGPFRLPGFDEVVARYPVTFCTTSLSPGVSEGERISVPVKLTGAFLKIWRYRSAMYEAEDAGLQRVPLIVGGQLERMTGNAADIAVPWGQQELIIAISVFVLIMAAAFGFWRWGRNDRRAAARRAHVLHADRSEEA